MVDVGEPAGFGPRDITQLQYGYSQADALGGSLYWASSLEFQTPMFFAPKDFGMKFAASPRHCDVLLVTGPVTHNMRAALERTYAAMPEPKWVVAAGDCAASHVS